MYTNDKITKQTELVRAEHYVFNPAPVYVFLMPRMKDDELCVPIEARLIDDKEVSECPFMENCWNPMVVKELNITEPLLQKYRIWTGEE